MLEHRAAAEHDKVLALATEGHAEEAGDGGEFGDEVDVGVVERDVGRDLHGSKALGAEVLEDGEEFLRVVGPLPEQLALVPDAQTPKVGREELEQVVRRRPDVAARVLDRRRSVDELARVDTLRGVSTERGTRGRTVSIDRRSMLCPIESLSRRQSWRIGNVTRCESS